MMHTIETDLLRRLRDGAGAADAARDLPADLIAEMSAAGMFRLLQPSRWGGAEAEFGTFLTLQRTLAEGSTSAAWVQGVFSVQAFLLAQMDDAAQADVWNDDPETLVCSSFQPVGTVQIAKGGYRLSGRWSFSSGCVHARWISLGAIVSDDGDRHMRTFLLPAADYRIDRVWDTLGLRATGSHDIIVEDAFIPGYRTWRPTAGLLPHRLADQPGAALYRLPWRYVFSASVANLGIGTVRRALADFLVIARERRSLMGGGATREDPAVQADISRVAIAIRDAEAQFDRHLSALSAAAENVSAMAEPEGQIIRAELTAIMRRMAAAIDRLQLHLGARGISMISPLTRPWLDLHAARAHPGNDPGAAFLLAGKARLES